MKTAINTNDKGWEIKLRFMSYFDGDMNSDPMPGTSSTYAMGICSLKYDETANELNVCIRRPGLLVGLHGKIINDLEKYLDCKVRIYEYDILSNTLDICDYLYK
jgi:hypothetical protein